MLSEKGQAPMGERGAWGYSQGFRRRLAHHRLTEPAEAGNLVEACLP
jgi:hypothetical protein